MGDRNGLDDGYVTLPEAARVLGVHRATVNDMVLSRRLRARRRRGQWFILQADLDAFAATYVRPPNAPPVRGRKVISEGGWSLLGLVVDWGDATVAELDCCVDLHEGNIRKQLRILESSGYVVRADDGRWIPTEAGRHTSPRTRLTA